MATKIPVRGYAASELDIQAEETAVGDRYYAIFAAWDGKHLWVFDDDFLPTMASLVCDFSNDIDRQLEAGEGPPEERTALRHAAQGLSTLYTHLSKKGAQHGRQL